jgi:hypothetical protein
MRDLRPQRAGPHRLLQEQGKLPPGVLAQYGNPPDSSVAPTILFAREEYYRAASLNAAAWSAVTNTLTVNLSPTDYPEETLTSLNWEPYRYNPNADPVTHADIGWEPYPIQD